VDFGHRLCLGCKAPVQAQNNQALRCDVFPQIVRRAQLLRLQKDSEKVSVITGIGGSCINSRILSDTTKSPLARSVTLLETIVPPPHHRLAVERQVLARCGGTCASLYPGVQRQDCRGLTQTPSLLRSMCDQGRCLRRPATAKTPSA